MGTWSAEPLGNDTGADFSWELDGQKRWGVVKAALTRALRSSAPMDSDVACTAIAAAEVVAHGLGRPTQSDVYTESVETFVGRASRPSKRLTRQAVLAVDAAARDDGELAQLWAEAGDSEWRVAISRLLGALNA
ncbi:DUF4259 domain-containing protein [Frondihabitans sp. 4ASC-45]|uniref:DUF4259 domain-containing protein n=1 Tax=Frondihabitans sp. 4ASC-45 TaxID=3111636 RepID=UPI003C2FACCB